MQKSIQPSPLTPKRITIQLHNDLNDDHPVCEIKLPLTKRKDPHSRRMKEVIPPREQVPFNQRDHWAREIDPNSQMIQSFLKQNGICLPAFDDGPALIKVFQEKSRMGKAKDREATQARYQNQATETRYETLIRDMRANEAHFKAYIAALEERIAAAPGVTINTKKLKALRKPLSL